MLFTLTSLALLAMAVSKHSTSDQFHKAPQRVLSDVSSSGNQQHLGTGAKKGHRASALKAPNRRRRSKAIPAKRGGSVDLQAKLDKTLSLLLEKAARQAAVSNDTSELLRSFRPCSICSKHRRYGEPHDGGYIMCDDDLKPGQIKAAYSYGISGFDGWGNDVSKALQIPVFEYDCTNPKRPLACPSCDLRFNLECINQHGAVEKANFGTLSQHLQKNGHHQVDEGSLLLKIDVEGAEWQVFAEEPVENLKKIPRDCRGISQSESDFSHALYLRAMKNILNAGFVVYHIHGNNWAGEVEFGTKRIPSVLEVTFLQHPKGSTQCESHTVTLPEDAVNNPAIAELQPAQLAL